MITINIDLGSAQEVKALVIGDHNLSAAATITLKGVEPTAFSDSVAWNSGTIIHYLSAATTKRYWQLQITDAANPDAYIEIGELFLGSYIELSRNYTRGYDYETELLMETNETPYGIRRDRFYNTQKQFSFDFDAVIAADITKMDALVTAVCDRTAGTYKPFWFNLDSDTPNDSYLVKFDSLPVKHKATTYFELSLEMKEIVKSV
jgi:hypothetical protein